MSLIAVENGTLTDMNAKEIAQLRRQFKKDNSDFFITNIATAYVSNENSSPVLKCFQVTDYEDLSESERTIYLNILKKALSGKLGKQLTEYSFETGSVCQQRLYDLNQSRLKDEEQIRGFVEDFSRNTSYLNGYYLILAACEWQIKDKNRMEDAGSAYRFLVCSVNEVTLTDIGLYFNQESGAMEKKEDVDMHVISSGLDGFLYPCYTDGGADVNHILYYTKTPKRPNEMFIENIIGSMSALPYDKENDCFRKMLADVAGRELDFDTVSHVYGSLRDMVAEAEGTSLSMDKTRMRGLLEDAGLSQESLQHYSAVYDKTVGDNELKAVNLMDPEKLTVKMKDISVTVRGDAAWKVKTRLVDGKRFLMIQIDDGLEVSSAVRFSAV